jgi:putative redox protein
MEVLIRHGEGTQSDAVARLHRVVCDQPFNEGGGNRGMTPPELMLSALGCCAMHYAAEYLRARNLSLDDLELRVTAEKGDRPVRLVEIGIEVHAPGLNAHTQAGLIKAVEACLLHRTLLNPPRVKIGIAGMENEESHTKELVETTA